VTGNRAGRLRRRGPLRPMLRLLQPEGDGRGEAWGAKDAYAGTCGPCAKTVPKV
jgi:hypothetical protein